MMTLTSKKPKVGAVAVFYKKAVLLGKRAELWHNMPVAYGGYWSIFGGSVEKGENPFHTASRELEEETQIIAPLKNLSFIKAINDPHCVFYCYAYEVSEMVTPILDEEHTEYGWFNINSLGNFPEKIDPKIIECIKLYHNL